MLGDLTIDGGLFDGCAEDSALVVIGNEKVRALAAGTDHLVTGDFDADLLLAVLTSHLVRDGLTPVTREQLLRTLDDLDHLNFLTVRKAENGRTYHFSNSVRINSRVTVGED